MPFAPRSPGVKVKASFLGLLCTYSVLVAFPPKDQGGTGTALTSPSPLFSSDNQEKKFK